MSKIDTNTVREKVVTMMGDLREVVDLYMRNEAEVAVVEGNHTFSREYKDTQIEKLREMGRASVRNKFDSLRSNCEMLIEVLRANDNIYDFQIQNFPLALRCYQQRISRYRLKLFWELQESS